MNEALDAWRELQRRATKSELRGVSSDSDDLIEDAELREGMINPNAAGGKGKGGQQGMMPPMMMGGAGAGGAGAGAAGAQGAMGANAMAAGQMGAAGAGAGMAAGAGTLGAARAAGMSGAGGGMGAGGLGAEAGLGLGAGAGGFGGVRAAGGASIPDGWKPGDPILPGDPRHPGGGLGAIDSSHPDYDAIAGIGGSGGSGGSGIGVEGGDGFGGWDSGFGDSPGANPVPVPEGSDWDTSGNWDTTAPGIGGEGPGGWNPGDPIMPGDPRHPGGDVGAIGPDDPRYDDLAGLDGDGLDGDGPGATSTPVPTAPGSGIDGGTGGIGGTQGVGGHSTPGDTGTGRQGDGSNTSFTVDPEQLRATAKRWSAASERMGTVESTLVDADHFGFAVGALPNAQQVVSLVLEGSSTAVREFAAVSDELLAAAARYEDNEARGAAVGDQVGRG